MLAALLSIISLSTSQEVPTILKNSACFMCLSKKQMIQGLVTIMGNQLLGAEFSAEDVVARVKCIQCASQKQLTAALLYSFCNLLSVVRGQE